MYKALRILAILMMLGVGFPVFAASHEYTCAELTTFTGGIGSSCALGVLTYPSGSAYFGEDNPSPAFPLSNGTVYYIYGTASTGSGKVYFESLDSGVSLGTENTTWDIGATLNATFIPANGGGSSNLGLTIESDPGVFSPNFTGTVGPICISDVSLADAQALCNGVPPAPPAPSFSLFSYLFGSATTTASTSLVVEDNPTQDYMDGIWTFLACCWFGVYLFKKR